MGFATIFANKILHAVQRLHTKICICIMPGYVKWAIATRICDDMEILRQIMQTIKCEVQPFNYKI